MVTSELLALGALFLASFFFAGTETALTSLGEARARKLRESLGDRGHRLDLWIEHPSKVLATLLIGNNVANVGAAAVATEIGLRYFQSSALAITTGIMTLALLVFGEITPKTIARERAEAVAVPALTLLKPFYLLFFPISWALEGLASGVSAALGEQENRPVVSSEDVDYYIELSASEGALEPMKRELLTSVLEFTDLVVKEIMIPRTQMVSLDVSTDPRDALDVVAETGHSRFPVFGENMDDIVGILSVKDLMRVLMKGTDIPTDLQPLLRDVMFVPEVKPVSELLKVMQGGRSHMAIVVDEFGGTSGIATLEDVVEEIVGEILDEHDAEHRAVRHLPDGSLLVEAAVNLRDLEDEVEVEFPDDGDYESLGGFMTAEAGHLPEVGEQVRFGGYQFTVTAADERRVLHVEIRRHTVVPGADEDGDLDAADGAVSAM
jgi:CBS domain containing-hemolysin-like protein